MNVRRAIQTLTLAISIVAFVIFVKSKKEAILLLWMLGLSFASLLVGRLFCGYFCPFHAFDKGIGFIFNKINLKKIKTPNSLKKGFVYYPISTILLLLVVLKIFSLTMPIRLKLPFLIIAFPILGVFTSDLWHNYLCPFGLVMKLPSFKRILMPKIDNNTCTNCNLCKNICPTEAIELNNNRLQIMDSRCILCYKCEKICKFDSIKIKSD